MRLLASSLLLSATATAQIPTLPPTLLDIDLSNSFVANGEPNNGPVGDIEPANLLGIAGISDAVFVRGGVGYVLTAPGMLNGTTEMDGAPTGIVSLRAFPGSGSTDTIAILSASGVSTWSLDLSTGDGIHTAVAPSVQGTSLHVGLVAGADTAAVTTATGVTLVNLVTGTTKNHTYGSTVLDAVLVDYNGDGSDEVCVVTTDSILVQNAEDATIDHSVTYANTLSAQAARLRTGFGDRFLAKIQTTGVTGEDLIYLEPASPSPDAGPPTLMIEALLGQTAYGLGAGDATNDGFDEIAYLTTGGYSDLLYNLRPIAPAPTNSFQYTFFGGVRNDLETAGSPGDFLRPAIADFDSDGDGELLLAWGGGETAALSMNGYINAGLLMPALVGDGDVVGTTLTIPLVLPAIGATEIQVLGWEMRSTTGPFGPVISMMPQGSHLMTFPVGPSVALPIDTLRSNSNVQGYNTHEGYMFLVRLVDTSGPTPIYYPPLHLSYAAPGSNWLLELDGGGRTVTETPLPPPPPPPEPIETPTPGEG